MLIRDFRIIEESRTVHESAQRGRHQGNVGYRTIQQWLRQLRTSRLKMTYPPSGGLAIKRLFDDVALYPGVVVPVFPTTVSS
jgi:hypothetical protein